MSTTSLKLPPELKARAAALAKRRGISAHAFMIEAIDRAADTAEKRAAFVADAAAARRAALRSGTGYAAEEVHEYLRRRADKGSEPRPPARSWRA